MLSVISIDIFNNASTFIGSMNHGNIQMNTQNTVSQLLFDPFDIFWYQNVRII